MSEPMSLRQPANSRLSQPRQEMTGRRRPRDKSPAPAVHRSSQTLTRRDVRDTLKVVSEIIGAETVRLYADFEFNLLGTRGQCSHRRSGVIWSPRPSPQTRLAAAFMTDGSLSSEPLAHQLAQRCSNPTTSKPVERVSAERFTVDKGRRSSQQLSR